MRVLFIVGTFPAVSEPFIINQVAGTLQRGHEVVVYASYGSPPGGSPSHPLVTEHRLMEYTLQAAIPRGLARLASGASLALRALPRQPLQTLRLLNVPRYGWQAASLQLLHRGVPLLGQEPFDIIHCQFGTLGLFALALRREGILRGPLVTTFRGHDISSFLRANGERIYDDLFREGEYFLSNCDFFRRRLVALGCDPNRLEVLFSGIDVGRFRYRGARAQSGDVLRIAFVGRLVEKKGLRYAIEAAAALRDAGVPFKLMIGGDGPLRAALQNQIDMLELGGAVTLVGALPQAGVVRLLEESDVLVAPSVTAENGDQDAPVNTLKEAMAIGLPVVGTRHGGIPELVEDGKSGYLVSERDALALADRLLHLARHHELWEPMGRQGRTRVETAFDSLALNDRLIDIYGKVWRLAGSSVRERQTAKAYAGYVG